MSDVWATFGKGMFVCLAIAGGIWIGRGGQLPLVDMSPQRRADELFAERTDSRRADWMEDAPLYSSREGRRRHWTQELDDEERIASRSRSAAYHADEHAPAPIELPERKPLQSRLATTDYPIAARGPAETLPPPILLADATASNPSSNPAKLVVTKIVNDQVEYRPEDFPRGIWARGAGGLQVHLDADLAQDSDLYLVSQNAPTTKIKGNPNQSDRKIWSFSSVNTENLMSAGIYEVRAGQSDLTSQVILQSLLLQISSSSASPQFSSWDGSKYKSVKSTTFTDPIQAAGGYLKLHGGAAGNAVVHLIAESGKGDQFRPTNLAWTTTADAQGNWTAELKLPAVGTPHANGRLLAYTEFNGRRSYATTKVTYSSIAPGTMEVSLLGVAATSTKPNSFSNPLLTNSRTVHVFFQPPTGFVDQTDVIFIKVGNSPRHQFQATSAAGSPIVWNIPNEGRHVVKLAIVRGDVEIGESPETAVVDLNLTGPRALNVELVNPLMTPKATVIRVAFEAANPPIGTIDKSLFQLQKGKEDLPDSTIASVDFIRDQNVVQLTTDKALEAGSYTLKIKHQAGNHKLQDAYGNLLNATPAKQEGAESTLSFFKSVGDELPSESRGLSGITGPNIEYKEYTDRRNIPEGFNPSDKVVTRVARLYYYRDAHRVVQLLNRTARSYNRQAVDQQQQLADNAQRNAQDATSNRRIAEREAVRAAQKARAAESALNQAQAGLVQAQAERLSAINGLPSIDSDLAAQEKVVLQRRQERDAAVSQQTELKNKQEPPAPPADVDAAQKAVDAANRQLAAAETELARLQSQKNSLVRQQTEATARLENSRRLVDTALGEVQAARQEEVRLTDTLAKLEEKEERDFRTLFLREVAAATADPDTYAPGNPKSDDPIAQVSLSVIGEGEIQLRGPLKGVNLARTLINQIDAPVGQVRVAIHTVQVNGERGERMEPVVERIQRYVDHSRFLTSQSAQMLRHAVTHVAAQQAEQVLQMCEGLTQQERDEKYLHAFFGKEFIAELYEMDSEFLRTGNKLLSLHSMDSTSLAQALFLLALAKNDVRMAILQEFERLTTCQLPQDEQEYFTASSAAYKFGPPFHKQKYQFLGHNARFVSLKGYFNAEVAGPDTITPMQREFIRLAQIFKSRLVAEREIMQRVMERSLIEDRFETDYLQELRIANAREKQSQAAVFEAQSSLRAATHTISLTAAEIAAEVRSISQRTKKTQDAIGQATILAGTLRAGVVANQNEDRDDARIATDKAIVETQNRFKLKQLQNVRTAAPPPSAQLSSQSMRMTTEQVQALTSPLLDNATTVANTVQDRQMITMSGDAIPNAFIMSINGKHIRIIINFSQNVVHGEINWDLVEYLVDYRDVSTFREIVQPAIEALTTVDKSLDSFALEETRFQNRSDARALVAAAVEAIRADVIDAQKIALTLWNSANLYNSIMKYIELENRDLELQLNEITQLLQSDQDRVPEAFSKWLAVRDVAYGNSAGDLLVKARRLFEAQDDAFRELLRARSGVKSAVDNAQVSRRPLDHKKFLDMLVDDSEDKYIEILEGTRAHTANVDNYLARIITALDDDFNTQFYHPTFKHVREAGRYWDVQMGQIETTTVLTNNRTFAKVSPQAMMEFDLPKRDILISEAFESAAAAYQDYGALLHDPTFLSLTKMYRGQPPSAVFNGGMPNPLVRDVLPGLPSATNEQLMIQQGATAPDFPSALESLIPDPAIYKFETGTGFEIRPVIQPDGQAVVFHLKYMYTTNLREPVRADEKHLGRIKRHFVDTDVNLGNFELREVSKYTVALKASRTARGVPLLEDVPVAGILFRPLPQQQSSLQQNLILSQATIFPTLFDLMGLRWAPAIADLGVTELKELDFVTRNRRQELQHRVFDVSSGKVDEFLQIPEPSRRPDLYRPQNVIPRQHPNGDVPHGLNMQDLIPSEGNMLILPGDAATMPSNLEQPLKVMEELLPPPPTGELRVIEPQSYQVPQSSQKEVSRSLASPPPSRPVPRGNGAEPGKVTLPSPAPQKLPSSSEARGPARKTSAVPSVSDRPLAQREHSAASTPAQPVVRSQDGGDVSITNPKAQENSRWRWKLPAWSR